MRSVLIAVALASIGIQANADPIVFNDFSDLSGIQLNGSAARLNPKTTDRFNPEMPGVLRLTDDLGQSGSAFLQDAVPLSNGVSFSAAFDFQITDPQGISDRDGQGADGIVFAVQTVPNRAGGAGGFIGYQGLGNSVGIEFDTWYNGGFDNDGNHVGISVNGSARSAAQRPVSNRMNNGAIWSAWVDYDGVADLLEVRLSEDGARSMDPFLSLSVDLESILGTSQAYVGFTSGTGAAAGDHDILSLEFRDDFSPITERASAVPAPGSLALFASGLLGVCAARRKVRGRTAVEGHVFRSERKSPSSSAC